MTSGARKVAIPSILGAGLPVPDVVITSEDVCYGKPDPEPYQKAAELLGVQPDDCLVFEDADSGIKAAIAAGMRVIRVGSCINSLENINNDMRLDNYLNIRVLIDEDIIIFELVSTL